MLVKHELNTNLKKKKNTYLLFSGTVLGLDDTTMIKTIELKGYIIAN